MLAAPAWGQHAAVPAVEPAPLEMGAWESPAGIQTVVFQESFGGPNVGAAIEPLGAERFSTENDPIRVPEPLLFDLVRPLGARQGKVEFNTLASFPWRRSRRATDGDPFGIAPNTPDRGGIEWAPEVEYAIVDDFAIEFEFPFEDARLEEYKLGLQWTIGTAFDNHYIHGVQVLIEPTVHWEYWNTTLLYIGGIRFDETWSALFMVGGRVNLEGPRTYESFQTLFNASLFADVNPWLTVGLETNYASHNDGSSEVVLVPQAQVELTDYVQVQFGLGFGYDEELLEQAFILRAIWSR